MNRKKFVSLPTVKPHWQKMGKMRRKVLITLLFFGMAQVLATDYRKLSGYVRQVISESQYDIDSPNQPLSRLMSQKQMTFCKNTVVAYMRRKVTLLL